MEVCRRSGYDFKAAPPQGAAAISLLPCPSPLLPLAPLCLAHYSFDEAPVSFVSRVQVQTEMVMKSIMPVILSGVCGARSCLSMLG